MKLHVPENAEQIEQEIMDLSTEFEDFDIVAVGLGATALLAEETPNARIILSNPATRNSWCSKQLSELHEKIRMVARSHGHDQISVSTFSESFAAHMLANTPRSVLAS